MRRALIPTAAALLATVAVVSATVHTSAPRPARLAAGMDTTGTWTANARDDDRLQLNMVMETSQWGQSMELADVTGLPAAALFATA